MNITIMVELVILLWLCCWIQHPFHVLTSYLDNRPLDLDAVQKQNKSHWRSTVGKQKYELFLSEILHYGSCVFIHIKL